MATRKRTKFIALKNEDDEAKKAKLTEAKETVDVLLGQALLEHQDAGETLQRLLSELDHGQVSSYLLLRFAETAISDEVSSRIRKHPDELWSAESLDDFLYNQISTEERRAVSSRMDQLGRVVRTHEQRQSSK